MPKGNVRKYDSDEGSDYENTPPKKNTNLSKQNTNTLKNEVCSMASYKRLETLYNNERKRAEYINKLYDDTKKTADASTQASDNLINQLRETISRLQSDNKSLQELYEKTEKKMNMMQTLTSISIDQVNEENQMSDYPIFLCKVYGKSNSSSDDPAIQFEVNLTETEVEYSPVHIRTDIKSHIPEYMVDDIAFEIQEAPVFISRLLDQVAGTN